MDDTDSSVSENPKTNHNPLPKNPMFCQYISMFFQCICRVKLLLWIFPLFNTFGAPPIWLLWRIWEAVKMLPIPFLPPMFTFLFQGQTFFFFFLWPPQSRWRIITQVWTVLCLCAVQYMQVILTYLEDESHDILPFSKMHIVAKQ